MPSFDAVNYSLRPNKTIQRLLVFEGLQRLKPSMPSWEGAAYLGFGSVWFTDFVLAHKLLGIDRLISIEEDVIGFRRANYNKPYRSVQVVHGKSWEIVPRFYDQPDLCERPWIAWFDYDQILGDEATDELQGFVEDAPENSVLLVTVNATHDKYGTDPTDKTQTLAALLGSVVPDVIPRRRLRGPDPFAVTMSELLEGFLVNAASSCARPGGFLPAFRLPYRDKAPMVTVGGILTSPERRSKCERKINSSRWEGFSDDVIAAPHLTLKELAVLQAQLPCNPPLDRAAIQDLGFDLGEDQISIFSRYYRQYPAFAQIGT